MEELKEVVATKICLVKSSLVNIIEIYMMFKVIHIKGVYSC
jgi:hypothetical protein